MLLFVLLVGVGSRLIGMLVGGVVEGVLFICRLLVSGCVMLLVNFVYISMCCMWLNWLVVSWLVVLGR